MNYSEPVLTDDMINPPDGSPMPRPSITPAHQAIIASTRSLSARQRELLIQRMDYHFTCQLADELLTTPAGRRCLSSYEIQALSLDDIPRHLFSIEERALLRFCDEMTDRAAITDDTWKLCSQSLSPAHVFDVIHLISEYAVCAFSKLNRRWQANRGPSPWPEYL